MTDLDHNAAGDHLHGILGRDFLMAHGALIDVNGRTLWLRRSP